MFLYKWQLTHEEYISMTLNDFDILHSAVWNLFGDKGSKRDYIYRSDQKRSSVDIYIQTSYEVEHIPKHGIILGPKEIQVDNLDGFYNFSVTLNPIVEKTINGSKRAKRIPLISYEDIKEYAIKVLENNGFKLDTNNLIVGKCYRNYSNTKGFYINTCEVRGRLCVIDSKKSLEAFKKGVGKEKIYGYGMICLTR